jgi:hypothetical protein
MNKISKISTLSIIICLLSLTGCHLIFENDIEDSWVTVMAPPDNYETENTSINFWWEYMEGADYYELQIYRIKGVNIDQLVVDSLIISNQFLWTFLPGEYQWNIRACNSAYCSKDVSWKFRVDSSQNLSGSVPVLISPSNDLYVNSSVIKFHWDYIYNADEYFFKLTDENSIAIYNEFKLDTTYLNIPGNQLGSVIPEGEYSWGVRAANAHSSTPYSYNALFVDRTKPSKPQLSLPANHVIYPDSNILFEWISGTDNMMFNIDTLSIYSDSLLTQTVLLIPTNTSSHVDSLGYGNYYWFVRSYDKAGNASDTSSVFKFSIQ